MRSDLKVPVGTTTVASGLMSLTMAVAFLVTLFFKVPDETAVQAVTAAFAILTFLASQVGRYWQSANLAKPAPVVVTPPAEPTQSVDALPMVGSIPSAHQDQAADDEMSRDPKEENLLAAVEARDLHDGGQS